MREGCVCCLCMGQIKCHQRNIWKIHKENVFLMWGKIPIDPPVYFLVPPPTSLSSFHSTYSSFLSQSFCSSLHPFSFGGRGPGFVFFWIHTTVFIALFDWAQWHHAWTTMNRGCSKHMLIMELWCSNHFDTLSVSDTNKDILRDMHIHEGVPWSKDNVQMDEGSANHVTCGKLHETESYMKLKLQ